MWQFNWLMPREVIFGAGRFARLDELAARFGRRIGLLTGEKALAVSGRLNALEDGLRKRGIEWQLARVTGEPTVEALDELVGGLRGFRPDAILAIGGGSVLDSGKAVAALLPNGGMTIDYLEGVGTGRTLAAAPLPLIAVPTTAGTGSEATKNAVIGDAARTFKKSMRDDRMLPAVALVDPELTYYMPMPVAGACGMDAIAQLLEAFTSNRAHPMSDAFARDGLALASALTTLCDREDANARAMMAMASLMGGICLANVGLGAAHGFASPLGAFYDIPHGVICAALLPAVVRANAREAQRLNDEDLLIKYTLAYELLARSGAEAIPIPETPDRAGWVAELNYRDPLEAAMLLADHLAELKKRLGIGGLVDYGVRREDFGRIAANARGNSMQSNPVALTDEALLAILEEAF
jgi:alcohol dehydrogenase